MSSIGPVGAEGPHGVGRAQPQQSVAKHAFNALGGILHALLQALEFGYLPKLERAELVASMFGAVNSMLSGGHIGIGVDWKNLPGPTLAKEKEMSHFLEAWVFFSAALGRSKPKGIPESLWKKMKDLLKKVHLPPALKADMKKILDDPAFQTLATDVIQNADIFAKESGWLKKRRDLFKGHPKLQSQYDKDQREAQNLKREIFNLDPSSPTYKQDKAKLEKKLHAKEADMRGLAGKVGKTGQYDADTAQINLLEKQRIVVMTRVRDKDIPDVQAGRGKMATAGDANRYKELTSATNELATYASGALSRAKVMAQMLAMKAGKLGPILSKLVKQMEKVAQFIIQQKLDESM